MVSEQIVVGRTEMEFNEKPRRRSGLIKAVTRSKNGQGWGLPIEDITPNQLRQIADMMEKFGVGSDEYLSDSNEWSV